MIFELCIIHCARSASKLPIVLFHAQTVISMDSLFLKNEL
nr:MAG TPA: hypothetical protein [Caudoviricetes sp.]